MLVLELQLPQLLVLALLTPQVISIQTLLVLERLVFIMFLNLSASDDADGL
jgi:hypothetical protein